jgi:catechol 2,3-dioxygenase-like lactoylglutathione lyase family enzyme
MRRRTAPQVFRLLLPARDLDRARRFYETLLGIRGRVVAPGRVYFDCGTVIVGILDY